YRISGSRPRLPIRITRLTLDISFLLWPLLERLAWVQFLPGLAAGFGIGEALGDEPVLQQRLAAAAHLLQRHALLAARVRDLVAGRELAQQPAPGRDGLAVLLLRVLALADPVLRVVAQVGVRVVLEVLRVFLDGQVVVAARVIGVGLRVQLARGGGLR